MNRPDPGDLLGGRPGESTAVVASRVARARERARARGVRCNAELSPRALDEYAPLTGGAGDLLERLVASGRLSGRGVQRVRRVALTLADLAGDDPPITTDQVATAHSLRTQPACLRERLAV